MQKPEMLGFCIRVYLWVLPWSNPTIYDNFFLPNHSGFKNPTFLTVYIKLESSISSYEFFLFKLLDQTLHWDMNAEYIIGAYFWGTLVSHYRVAS